MTCMRKGKNSPKCALREMGTDRFLKRLIQTDKLCKKEWNNGKQCVRIMNTGLTKRSQQDNRSIHKIFFE